MKRKLLIVEDDPMLGMLIRHYFEKNGWSADIALDGDEAFDRFEEEIYHLILLDVMLPKKDGFTICREIRKNSDVPIFFITARVLEEDELKGYSLGADDYITKPFSLPVLYAKAVSCMRRLHGGPSLQMIQKGDISVDLGTGEVRIREKICTMPKLEYDMLLYFMENPNRVLSRDQFITRLWGFDFDGNERVVDNHIKNLRKLIAESQCRIITVHKSGYKMEVKQDE